MGDSRLDRTTRRRFLQTSGIVGAGLLATGRRAFARTAHRYPNLRKFVAPLPGLNLAGANTTRYNQTGAQADFYRIVMGQYRQQFHPDLPPTTLWGYADATNGLPRWSYLGATIVATKGTPTRINFVNLLPPKHPLPIDHTLPGAEPGQPVNRASVHLHGGFVPWTSDGGPFQWTTPLGLHGPTRLWWLPDRLGLLTDDLWYPNAQSARLLWYHDHAMGITRLNAYAGLAAGYVLVDADEIRMFGAGGSVLADQLPGIPLVLQDKSFKTEPDHWGDVGDLAYPTSYGPLDGPATLPMPKVSCVPEFFADTPLINGMAYPQLTLPAGVHRFRILNGTQSRMWNLQLYRESKASRGDPDLSRKGPDFVQIGTEGGFLPRPAVVDSGNRFSEGTYDPHNRDTYSLLLGGAERADLLIDFSDCAGSSFILYNDAAAPFPSGEASNDYFTGNPENPASAPRSDVGPNTRTLMRMTITAGSYSGPTLRHGSLLRLLEHELARNSNNLELPVPDALVEQAVELPPPGARMRVRTLNEGVDDYGRLAQFVGTGDASVGGAGGTTYGMMYMDALTEDEKHARGATEVWDIYNTTGDTHPIHFHLVNVQVLGRAPFVQDGNGNPVAFEPSGAFLPPDDNERGFKETVRMNPGEVTRVIMKFDLPPAPVVNVRGTNRTIAVPTSPRTGGHEYVWHCHILEHEEHDMMRPFVVVA
jgi:spore coat protein A